MNTNLENFKPRLRPGRVIPQGPRIIFETNEPFNQIILPMGLADMILLCSGQFSVREIVGKIYHRQGAVPFKNMLTALHHLHQGNFFENGEELELSPELKSWMNVRKPYSLSRRLLPRLSLSRARPKVFYALTMATVLFAIFGLAQAPVAIVETLHAWLNAQTTFEATWRVLLVGSVLQTLAHGLRTLQLLALTGQAFNLSVRIGGLGVYLHVGDETTELIDNRLYAALFYASQILAGWPFVFAADLILIEPLRTAVILVAAALTFHELNPFFDGAGRRLIRALLRPGDRDVSATRFAADTISAAIDPRARRHDRDFARACALAGAGWLTLMTIGLYDAAIIFGPGLLTRLTQNLSDVPLALVCLCAWLRAVYYVAQTFVESIVANVIRPYWRVVYARAAAGWRGPKRDWTSVEVTDRIETLPLFSHFPENFLEHIALSSQVMEVPAGAAIIREGSPAAELFVLFEGTVAISRQNGEAQQDLGVLGPVSVFGEAALIDNAPRAAQVAAKTRATVLRVPITVLRKVATEADSVRKLEVFRNAILVNQYFASSPVFRSLSTTSIDFLCSRGTLAYFDQDQVVFQQGDRGDSLYLMLRGSVTIEVHGHAIRRLDQGSFFGEIAMIASLPRTATVRTVNAGVFFKIDADDFWEVLVQHLDLGVFLESISEERLKEDLAFGAERAAGGSI